MMNLREWALPVYTILIQLATGALLGLWVIRALAAPTLDRAEIRRIVKRPILVILLTIIVAMAGAHFHLSRPLQSYLAMINLATSWLSREVLFTFLLFAAVGLLAAVQSFGPLHERLETFLGWLAITLGLVSIFCMSEIYDLPAQAAWNSRLTALSFYATTLLVGSVSLIALLVMDWDFTQAQDRQGSPSRESMVRKSVIQFANVAGVTTGLVLIVNLDQVLTLQSGNEFARTSLQLLLGLYGPLFTARLGAVVVGAGVLLFATWTLRYKRKSIAELIMPVYFSFLLILIGEILGRFLFYATHIRQGL
jgi:anaerobic dimethyl sulfoxide reductase subunit C (anchor subunit)